MLWMLHNVTALQPVKITWKNEIISHFFPFQDDLVLYTKYFMLSKGVYSVSLKHTTVKPAQVKLAYLQLSLQLYIFTNIIERFLTRS